MLFREHGERYIGAYKPDRQQIKLIRAIRLCRTPALGGTLIRCNQCDHKRYQYLSCGHSQCPICQGIKRARWQDQLSERMLKVPYCHVTFTLPHELNGMARRNPTVVYNLLMRSAWNTVKKLVTDKDEAGGLPGMSCVLHTWGSDLKYHVHVHCLVTFGGLNTEGSPEWVWPKRRNKLASFRRMSSTFRAVFLKALEPIMQQEHFVYHRSYGELRDEMIQKRWVVHSTPPVAETQILEEYLSRYICRIGISNSRIQYDQALQQVHIQYNDYRNQLPGQAAPKAQLELDPLLAMHNLLQHVLPPYFQRSRHYGLHAGSTYRKYRPLVPHLVKQNGQSIRTLFQILKLLIGATPDQCPSCQSIDLEYSDLLADPAYLQKHLRLPSRSPPQTAACA